ncbi:hypothetical protein GCM10010497_25800 [Streptomyces cinereoruber]|uniref:Uncharacterized protein n=1 Tax=Streptomyces cinereoruber TaxID=67260 RepID=A0AAV4KIT9_9ACTN|nr:hypothetical protein [Streptomyces cinereoruber]MBB4160633.1 hypothetical protein [Streptomyces cinereoruber]MBY8819169.1 hypothetical protein [Streptomyces cinereoruber]NIH62848.1 hypothetical protein [Streptomyces cinereoruber]QEV31570.1 hypothetical protein CP977_04835 [Streptomyces cinereoruber]GGR22519.1 hypothetical protein GCM10010497_25800 [Streptomyces cinereoruber]
MDLRKEEDSGTRNDLRGKVYGDVTQIGTVVNPPPRKRWLLLVGLPVLAALATVGGVLAAGRGDAGPLPADGEAVKTEAVADTTTNNWECGDSAVVPGLRVGAEGLPVVRAFPRDGVQADRSVITVTLQGTTQEELVLTGARTVIVSRRPPVEGTHLAAVCASEVPVRAFEVDLDIDGAPLVPVPDPRPKAPKKTVTGWPYAIKEGDAEHFVISPKTMKYDTEFRIVVRWSSGGSKGEVVLDDHGKPFRYTATTAADPLCAVPGQDGGYRYLPAASPRCPGKS